MALVILKDGIQVEHYECATELLTQHGAATDDHGHIVLEGMLAHSFTTAWKATSNQHFIGFVKEAINRFIRLQPEDVVEDKLDRTMNWAQATLRAKTRQQ